MLKVNNGGGEFENSVQIDTTFTGKKILNNGDWKYVNCGARIWYETIKTTTKEKKNLFNLK